MRGPTLSICALVELGGVRCFLQVFDWSVFKKTPKDVATLVARQKVREFRKTDLLLVKRKPADPARRNVRGAGLEIHGTERMLKSKPSV